MYAFQKKIQVLINHWFTCTNSLQLRIFFRCVQVDFILKIKIKTLINKKLNAF